MREVKVTIRVTQQEKQMLESCAGSLGMTQTQIIINGIKLINEMIQKHKKGHQGG